MVLSDPQRNPAVVVIGNLSTDPGPGENQGCVVESGEHPFVSRTSFVRCDQVRVTTAAKIEAGLVGRVLSAAADLSGELLVRVQKAVGQSPLAMNDAKSILRAQGFVA
jgi:hypothetical protein